EMPVLPISQLKDTTLWRRLNNDFSGPDEDLAKTLARQLIPLCNDASNRMKRFPSLHSEYTLHDEIHLLRVTELMALIVPTEVELNPIEIALLILAAHFHDQGMVMDREEIVQLKNNPGF